MHRRVSGAGWEVMAVGELGKMSPGRLGRRGGALQVGMAPAGLDSSSSTLMRQLESEVERREGDPACMWGSGVVRNGERIRGYK